MARPDTANPESHNRVTLPRENARWFARNGFSRKRCMSCAVMGWRW